MKRVLALVLVLAMTLAMAACSSTEKTTGETKAPASNTPASNGSQDTAKESGAGKATFDGCLNVAIPSDPADLSPFVTMSVGRMYTLETVYEYLGNFEEKNGEFKGQLAKDIQINDGGKTLVVTLWDDITDSAGNHITAADVIFSYEKAIETQCSTATGYIDSIDKIDEYTVQFNMNSTIVDGWSSVLSAIPVVSQASFEDPGNNFSTKPITTSAYVIDEFISGSSLHMTRRDDYWGDAHYDSLAIKSEIKEIEFDVILESSQMSIALETGKVEIAEGMATNEVARFMEGGENYGDAYNTVATPDSRIYVLLYNMSGSSMVSNDLNLRQAMAYAIDAAGLVDGVLNGGGATAIAVGSRFSSDYNPDWNIPNYEYDLDKAKELLAQSGYNGETLKLVCQSGGYQSATCELVQAYLLAIGVNTTIDVVDSGLFDSIKYDPNEWDIMVDGIGGQKVASFAHQQDSKGKSFFNACLIDDPQWQALIEACTYEETMNDETIKAWCQYTHDMNYLYPLFTGESYVATSSTVTNIVFTPRSCVFVGDVQIAD